MRLSRRSATLAALTVLLAGCGTPGHTDTPLTVAAAGALRPAFTRIAEAFHAANPDVTVRFDFASSPELATQLVNGATADVFASADTVQMDKVSAAGLLHAAPVTFATNTLVIITAPGNPKHLSTLADLARPGVTVVVSPPPMPCGVATERLQQRSGIRLHPVSSEPDVDDVVNKVSTGQADAGLVNVTDAVAVGERVATVALPEAAADPTAYPVAVLAGAAHPGPAQRFVDYLTGGPGRAILHDAGFGSAEPAQTG